MQSKDHFSRLAAQYAAFRPRYPADLFEYLAGLCPERGRAWDCACGNGQASVDLAQRFERVDATDASARQIELAQPHPRVHYRAATAEHSGLPNASCDLITVAQALHWFAIDEFMAEARRVLKSGGIIAVWTYRGLHLGTPALDALVQEFQRLVAPYWPPERALVDEGYRSIAFPFEELSPPAFAMMTTWTLDGVLGYLRSWSATARYADAHGADPVAPLGEDLAAEWGEPHRSETVSFSLAMRVGRR